MSGLAPSTSSLTGNRDGSDNNKNDGDYNLVGLFVNSILGGGGGAELYPGDYTAKTVTALGNLTVDFHGTGMGS